MQIEDSTEPVGTVSRTVASEHLSVPSAEKWTAVKVGSTGGSHSVDVYEVRDARGLTVCETVGKDANLIAAAPDMREALEAMLTALHYQTEGMPNSQSKVQYAVKLAAKAIAKVSA